jgi:hypothetical protein
MTKQNLEIELEREEKDLVEYVRQIYLKVERRKINYSDAHGNSYPLEIEPFDLIEDMKILGYSPNQYRRVVIRGGISNLFTRIFIPSPVNDYFWRLHNKAKLKGEKDGI